MTTKKMMESLSSAIVVDHSDLIRAFDVFIVQYQTITFDQLIINALRKLRLCIDHIRFILKIDKGYL